MRESRVMPLGTRSLFPFAEAALVAVTLAAVASFWRLFVDWSFFPSLALLALAAHAAAITCRRTGRGLGRAALAYGVAGVVLTTWVLYGDTTSWLLPTGATLDQAGNELSDAWVLFQDVLAPTEVEPGYVLAAALSLWVSIFVADWAAFRLWVPFEAVVPAGTLFLFASMLGSSTQRGTATVLFLVPVLGFVLLHRVARQQSSTAWLATDIDRGSMALLKTGGALAAVAVLIAAVAGPLLPGSTAEAVLAWRDIGDDPDSRQTVSPLVEIRGRLVEQSAVELFTVRSPVRSYWRITSLDIFDGEVWSSKGDYGEADGNLDQAFATSADQTTVVQEVAVKQLAAIWLPAAFEPTAIRSEDYEVRWDDESSTLIVDNEYETSDGASYQVQSAIPTFDPRTLGEASSGVPDDVSERYLELPGGFSDRVRAQAQAVVDGQSSPYERALALQNYFRDQFTYDLTAPDGHDEDVIEQFLFETQRGYCEQFAGSYAAMARAVGLPSRVAVGFTPGDNNPDGEDPDLYVVRGLHAHAWPEVFISGFGWVAFEPTPNRGIPGARSYTGVDEQQANSANPSTATTLETVPQPAQTDPEQTPTTASPIQDGLGAGDLPALEAPESDPSLIEEWWPRVAVAVLVVVGLVLLYVVGAPLVRLARRRRRRRRAVEPGDQVRVAWRESAEAMSLLGVEARPAETPAEFAARTRRVLESEFYDELATSLEAADYSETGVSEEEADRAWELSAGVEAEVRSHTTRKQRLVATLDPRR